MHSHIPWHCLGCTHSFLSQSMTVPAGHWHPLTIQIRGQGTGPVLLQARWQLGSEAHSSLICPLMGHAVINRLQITEEIHTSDISK